MSKIYFFIIFFTFFLDVPPKEFLEFIELFTSKITISYEWRTLIFTGVLASFTTFSSFALDVALLTERNEYFTAVLYIGGSVILSIGFLFLGLWAMRGFLS